MDTPTEKEVDFLLRCTTTEFVNLVQGQEYKAVAEREVTIGVGNKEKVYTQYKVNGAWYRKEHFEVIG